MSIALYVNESDAYALEVFDGGYMDFGLRMWTINSDGDLVVFKGNPHALCNDCHGFNYDEDEEENEGTPWTESEWKKFLKRGDNEGVLTDCLISTEEEYNKFMGYLYLVREGDLDRKKFLELCVQNLGYRGIVK